MTESGSQSSAALTHRQTRDGLVSAFIAYFVWGAMPIYFLAVKNVGVWEILAHRIVWAIPFGALIIFWRKQWPEVRAAWADSGTLRNLIGSAIFIAGNWLVYILAVQQEQIFQASLGYYINPLIFALFGVFVFGEKLRVLQILAIALAATGVTILAVSGGSVPVIAFILGVSFALYGVIRKVTSVGAMPGLFVETLLLVPFALIFLVWTVITGASVFLMTNAEMDLLLLLAGPITVIPLLFFALAAKRLTLTTVGMMQFIAPTLQFLVGYWSGEVLTAAHIACFAFIWIAVALFSWDSWVASR